MLFRSLETRIAILQKKSQSAKVNIQYNLLEYIAERVSSNIREMEGVLTKVMFLAKLNERKVDLDICQEALNDYRVQECDEITADEIINCTCRYFNVQKADVVGKKKNKEIVEPRQIAMYLINELMTLPLCRFEPSALQNIVDTLLARALYKRASIDDNNLGVFNVAHSVTSARQFVQHVLGVYSVFITPE